MQNLDRLIDFYHIAFIVCIVLAVVFLLLSILAFFKFDILAIIDIMSGRGAQREIQRMAEENAQTGRLRPTDDYTNSLSLKNSEKLNPKAEVLNQNELRNSVKREEPVSKPKPSEVEETTLLNTGGEETTILDSVYPETSILNAQPEQEKAVTEVKEIKEEKLEPLIDDSNETIELSPDLYKRQSSVVEENTVDVSDVNENQYPGLFKIEKMVVMVHSEEIL